MADMLFVLICLANQTGVNYRSLSQEYLKRKRIGLEHDISITKAGQIKATNCNVIHH